MKTIKACWYKNIDWWSFKWTLRKQHLLWHVGKHTLYSYIINLTFRREFRNIKPQKSHLMFKFNYSSASYFFYISSFFSATWNSRKSLWCRSTTYLGFWRKQGPAEAVHVAQVHLDAGVGEVQLVEAGGVVARADVTLAGEGGDGDGVLQLRLRQVIADPAIHVTLQT